MSVLDLVMFVISAGIMLYGVWKFLPGGIYVFFPSLVRSHFDANNASLQILQRGNVRSIAEKLEAFGLDQIGVKIEQRPLWGSVSDLSLASNSADVFASITVINNKTLYYFFTPFSGVQAVLTANDGFPAVNTENFIQSSVYSTNPTDLSAIHQKCVDELRNKGLTPFQEYTQQTRIDATTLYYKINSVRKKMRTNGAIYLILLIFFCFPFFYIIFNMPK